MNKIETNMVKDGNSMAVRIPKTAMKLSGITGGPVVLYISKNEITIKNYKQPRQAWATAIKKDVPIADNELSAWDEISGEALDD